MGGWVNGRAVAAPALGLAGPVLAWGGGDADQNARFGLGLASAPYGTVCGVSRARARRVMAGSFVQLRGGAPVGDVFCTLPDGRRDKTGMNRTGVAQFPDAYAIVATIDLRAASGRLPVQTRRGEIIPVLKAGEGYGLW